MKKFLVSLFIFFGLSLSFAHSAQASRWVEWRTPDIKNEFCGVHINFKYCKCAFHGQYCKELGIDSAASNNYVNVQFGKWVEGLKNNFFSGCKIEDRGIAKPNGCLWCDDVGEFVWNGECGTSKKLCSEDPNIKFNTGSGQCECRVGFNLLADKTCESICPVDVPGWMYDVETEKCICSKGYELDKNEEGEDYCKELPEVNIDFKYLDSESILADGKGKIGFSVFAESNTTGETIPLKFKLTSNNKSAEGSLEVVSNDPELYLLEYKSPDLLDQDPATIKNDQVSVSYTIESGTQTKSFEIDLFVGMPIKISKPGFESTEAYIQFKADTAKVKVMTATRNMQEFPVADALVETKSGPEMRTDEEGMLIIDNPRKSSGEGEVTETKAFLTIDPAIDALRTKTMDQYIQTGLTDNTVEDYVRNFEKYLAQSSGNENQKATVDSLKRIQYSLFYIKEGNEMGGVAAKKMAGAIKDAIWNVIDSIESIGDLGGLLDIELLKKYSSLTDQAKKGAQASFDFMSDKLKSVKKDAWEYVASTFSTAVTKYAPNYNGPAIKGLFDFMISKVGNESLKLSYNDIQFEGMIEEYFVKEQKEKSKKGMAMIASRINENNWVPLYGNDWLEQSKENYQYLMKRFNDASETEYTVSAIKDFSEIGIDTVNTAANFFPQFKAFATGLDLYYKGVRTAFLDSRSLFSWFETGSDIADMTFASSAKALGMPKGEWTNPAERGRLFYLPARFIGMAYAEEGTASDEDLEAVLAERDTLDETNRNNLVEYSQSSVDAEFYSEWAEAAKFLMEIYPEEKNEIQAFINDFEAKGKVAEAKKEELADAVEPIIGEMKMREKKGGDCENELDENCDGQVDLKDITWQEWTALGVMVVIFYFIAKGIRRLFKRKKKK